MTLTEALNQIREIQIPKKGVPVEKTVASELLDSLETRVSIRPVDGMPKKTEAGVFYIAVANKEIREYFSKQGVKFPSDKDWIFFTVDDNQCCWLISPKPQFLFTAFCYVMENLRECNVSHLKNWLKEMSFSVEKSTFDIFLTQYARLIRNFDRELYIREYARLGFTHIEVNALAYPFSIEEGVPGEFYPDFYTYCPALDQFVESRLNQGTYPKEYLEANLDLLKQNAHTALQYGLIPGLLCFEPRSVPEKLFQKYPTLRGARVDHPFRSFKPRFNLSTVHPAVQKHYEELMTNLLKEVPELEFLTIWSNDSGAGFEHTKSLYVGRNGGAYLIREWKDDEQIAKAAAHNIGKFFTLLLDAACRINSRFRVITRLESFYGEREYLWGLLKNRIDVEVNSLLARGWESNYPHPQYPDVKVLGSAFHNTLWDEEKEPKQELQSRKSHSFFYHSFCSHTNHEPLLGIPFPWLTHEKLRACHRLGLRTLAHLGGIQPPDKVPYAVNQEVFRHYQFDPEMDIDQAVKRIAASYAGDDCTKELVKGWRLIEEAIRSFTPLSIYTHYGVVWQRLFIRPLVCDIDRIPEKERVYYEKFMCTSIHNPNRIDLAKDVLFELISKDYAEKSFNRIDDNVWEPLESAIELFREKMEDPSLSSNHRVFKVFEDQYYRAKALRCLYETLRNTAVWIYGVHEYLETNDASRRAHCRKLLNEMMEREVQNCWQLIQLWKEAPIEWMIVSGTEETPFIYGENFMKHLEKKIALMEEYKDAEPFIDPDYMFKIENNPYDK